MVSEYALAGVDYTKIQPFKDAMLGVVKATRNFPKKKRGVHVMQDAGNAILIDSGIPVSFRQVTEGLGNKNWIAQWMYQFEPKHAPWHYGIAIDNALMAANDVIVTGHLPVAYSNEVAAGDSDWFTDDVRSTDLAKGYEKVCSMCSMAMVGGESPSLKYLVKATPPVKSAPVFSGCVTGIAKAGRTINRERMWEGDVIIAVKSSGIHSNGISLVINKALEKNDYGFLEKLPNGNTIGEEALIPTMEYVTLVETLLSNGVDIHALLPGTGDGVAKLASDKRSLTYKIHSWWDEIPLLMVYMNVQLGVSLVNCLKTFNWGSGYYIFTGKADVQRTIDHGTKAGYQLLEIGTVEAGKRGTIFGPANNLFLEPPGE